MIITNTLNPFSNVTIKQNRLVFKEKPSNTPSIHDLLQENANIDKDMGSLDKHDQEERKNALISRKRSLERDIIAAMENDALLDPKLLDQLLDDWRFKHEAMKHPNLPIRTLQELFKRTMDNNDYSSAVAIVQNPNTTGEMIRDIYKQFDSIPDDSLDEKLSNNSRTPSDILDKLEGYTHIYATSENYHVLRNLSKNPNTSVEALSKLAKHYDYHVRYGVLENTGTPTEIIKYMAEFDRDDVIRALAQKRLRDMEKK